MFPLKVSTALTVPVFAHDVNGDGVTGLLDGGFTKRISKDGGAFAAMTVTVSELEGGWYALPLSTAHTDTSGILTMRLTHASAKDINLQFRVHSQLVDEVPAASDYTTARAANLDNLDAAVSTRATPAQVNTEVDAALNTAIPGAPTADSINERLKRLEEDVTPTRAGNLDNLDAAMTTRSSHSAADVWSAITATAGNFIADHILRRSFAAAAASANGDAKGFRSALGAIAKLVNKVSISGSTLTVFEADDTTSLGTQSVTTDAAADPITSVDTT